MWKPISDIPETEDGRIMLLYNEGWIDEEFNPTGTAMGYHELGENKWAAAFLDTEGEWFHDCDCNPTHWAPAPKGPK